MVELYDFSLEDKLIKPTIIHTPYPLERIHFLPSPPTSYWISIEFVHTFHDYFTVNSHRKLMQSFKFCFNNLQWLLHFHYRRRSFFECSCTSVNSIRENSFHATGREENYEKKSHRNRERLSCGTNENEWDRLKFFSSISHKYYTHGSVEFFSRREKIDDWLLGFRSWKCHRTVSNFDG